MLFVIYLMIHADIFNSGQKLHCQNIKNIFTILDGKVEPNFTSTFKAFLLPLGKTANPMIIKENFVQILMVISDLEFYALFVEPCLIYACINLE